jgi:hypothetical protein
MRWDGARDRARALARALLNGVHDLPDPPSRRGAAMMWAGHRLIPVVAIYSAYAIPYALLGQPGGPLEWGADAFEMAFLFVFWSEIRWHGKRLCERCAAKTPLDPQAKAARWRPALLAAHRMTPYLLIGVALSIWLNMLGEALWVRGANVALVVVFFLVWLSLHVHDRLRPWCPWCDWGKGGKEEVSPEVPDPALSK